MWRSEAAALPSRAASSTTSPASTVLSSRSFGSSSCAHAKKRNSRASARGGDEDAFPDVEPEDDGDLFAISDSVSTFKSNDKSLPTRQTIQQSYQELAPKIEAKLLAIAERQSYEPPRHSSFRNLAQIAKNADELLGCLSIASRWNELGERKRLGLRKLRDSESVLFAGQAMKQGLPELAFYAIAHRSKTGLEFDLDLLRQVQAALVSKLVKTVNLPQEEARAVFLESQQLEGVVQTLEPWNGGASSQGAEEGSKDEGAPASEDAVDAQRGLLSLIDRTLVLTSISSAFSRAGIVDLYCLMLSIDAHIRPVQTLQESTTSAFVAEQVRPRLQRALDVLSSTMAYNDVTTLDRLKSLSNNQFQKFDVAIESLSTYASQEKDVSDIVKSLRAARERAATEQKAEKAEAARAMEVLRAEKAAAEAEAAKAAEASEAARAAEEAGTRTGENAVPESQSEREWLGKKG